MCAFDGEHGPFVVVLVGALFVGSMSTVWHGEITPWRARRTQRCAHRRRAAAAADRRRPICGSRAAPSSVCFNMGSTVLLLLPPGLRALGSAALQPGAAVRVGQGLGSLIVPGALVSWRPTAALPTLRLRAELLAAARAFFAERGVLEVDTPALVRHAVTDLHIHSAQVQLPGHRAPLFLHTSPEYAMKRLLAAGSGDIYQIAHVFRGDERSRLAQRRVHADRVVSLRLSRCSS